MKCRQCNGDISEYADGDLCVWCGTARKAEPITLSEYDAQFLRVMLNDHLIEMFHAGYVEAGGPVMYIRHLIAELTPKEAK